MMHPHLGVNVKQLILEDDEDSIVDIYRFFSDIIPLLPKIISLEYNSLPIPYLHLPIFSSDLRSLTSLALWNIKADSFGDFVRFVSFHKQLKELTISECSWERSSVHHYSFGVRWGRDLKKLSFEYCEYRRIFDVLYWLGRRDSPCSIQCLEIKNPQFLEEPVVPFIATHLATQWAPTLEAVFLQLDDDIQKAGDSTEAAVSSLTAYIRFCPNLHTIKLKFDKDTLWVVRQLPDVLSGLVSLRRIAFRFLALAEAESILLGDNENKWATVDKDLGDSAKLRSLEYVEVSCSGVEEKDVLYWWENGKGSSEDTESDSGRESNGEDVEVESIEERYSRAKENLIGKRGKQQKQGISWGVLELEPWGLGHTMIGITHFHRRKKALTDIFPHLSARGVLWCGIGRYSYVLHITASNLSGMKSRDWRPRYCASLFDQDVDLDYD
ncbi:hypothetical protein NLI96_g7989 [Meripilus lineatus]|uniref:Uncharacterized protein n=1 Tax=Meripilus lineatus TaxID=2056292 RepID=A0AAD5UY55_9APHY|nr:hypothetical protein NLI96_g7989 [Physisporinus lineatus]